MQFLTFYFRCVDYVRIVRSIYGNAEVCGTNHYTDDINQIEEGKNVL